MKVRYDTAKEMATGLVEIVKAKKSSGELADGDIVCAGGRGLGDSTGFSLLKQLADALGGEIGVTRGPVNMGLCDSSCMIGQTGVTVRPKIYIACGISGAMQHMAGVQGAYIIIAINKDREAPIFDIATHVFVGDLFEVIPEIIAAL